MLIYNPINFNPSQLFPQKLCNHARMFLHIILNQQYKNKSKENSFIPLKAIILRKTIHDKYSKIIRETLVKNNVIECDYIYFKKFKCYGFRFSEEYRKSKIIPIEIKNKKTLEPILNEFHQKMYKWLEKVEIDYDGASAYLEKQGKVDEVSLKWLSLEKLKIKDFYFHCDKRGRIYTNITHLWSNFREFLTIDKRKLFNIDVKNTHPLIFAHKLKLINSIIYNILYIDDAPFCPQEDVGLYIDLVQQGQFYNYLMDEFGIDENKRNWFKKKLFSEVFYSKTTDGKWVKKFNSIFPNVFKAICYFKRENYKDLSLDMQKIEADLMIGNISKRLVEENIPFLTIHDSFLVHYEYIEKIKLYIREAFKELELTCSFG